MNLKLNRFRIRTRIHAGFALLILLTMVLAVFSTVRIAEVQRQTGILLALSDNTTRVLETGRLLETLQRAALRYQTSGDESAVRTFEEARVQARDFMDAASKASDGRNEVYRDVLGGLEGLEPKFQALVALETKIKDARGRLYTGGDALTQATQRLVDAAGHDSSVSAEASRVESAMLLVRVANWRFLATRDSKGPAIFATNAAAADRALRPLTSARGNLADLANEVGTDLAAYRQNFEEISGSMIEIDRAYENEIGPSLAQLHSRLESTQTELTSSMQETQKATSRLLSSTFAMQLIVGGALVVLGILFALVIAGSIVGPLAQMTEAMRRLAAGETDAAIPARDGADEIADMGRAVQVFRDNEVARQELETEIANGAIANTQQIAATAKEQQVSASEVAATVTEIGATSKEISATSKELVRTMGEVAHAMEQSATLATSGQGELGQMESTMRNVMEAAGAINSKLTVLNEKAGNINQVVVTITKVADQTNLLSLNAAIEAEKAGEYGRGFSVVATEIRRLADQTAVATYDIEQIVKEIQSAVAAGVMGMDKFSEEVRSGMSQIQEVGAQLSQIIQQVQALAPRVETVNEGVQAQATGAEQITDALSQLTEATSQTVESLRQSAAAIEELNRVSTGLRNGLSRASSQRRKNEGPTPSGREPLGPALVAHAASS